MSILVAADFDAAEWALWWPLLQAALPNETLVRDPTEASNETIDVAIVANPAEGSLRGLPGLRLIQSLWAGVDRLLADAGVPAEVPIARMVDPAMNTLMAQTALWAVLGLQRGFFACARQQRAALWQAPPWCRADDLSIAVLGFGQMGRSVAACLLREGYRVHAWSRQAAEAMRGVSLHTGDAGWADVLDGALIAINLLPLTPATRGLLDAAAFARMPRGASFVNLARGAHMVEADLLAALAGGHLRHAVLDVFETEPLPPTHPFWSHPAITVLPHIAAPTDARSAAAIAAENVRALREGRPLRHLVDRLSGY